MKKIYVSFIVSLLLFLSISSVNSITFESNNLVEKLKETINPETNKLIVLLTNQFEWSASIIANVYKRWLTDRSLLQNTQTAAQGKEPCRYFPQHFAVPIAGCTYRFSAPLLYKFHVPDRLVFIYTEFNTPNESVCK